MSAAPEITRPSLGRLTLVELRKMVDTRAGLWLQLATALLTIAIAVLVAILGSEGDRTLRGLLGAVVSPASFLLPIMGVLLVTSEWSQRTGVITFTLVPDRTRVLVAKAAAGVVLALAVVAICLVVTLVATALAGSADPDRWALPVALLLQHVLALVLGVVGGVAFGALVLVSAPAIVATYLAPIAFAALVTIPSLTSVGRWLDPVRTLGPLTDHVLHGTEWARAGTTELLWLVLPLVVGAWRIARSEVR
jgi:ABC-2 type transport system permease protein